MPKFHAQIGAAFLIFSLVGCADEKARQLAEQTSSVLIAYSAEVTNKANAEAGFVSREKEIIGSAYRGKPLDNNVAPTPAAVQNSIYYGRIVTANNTASLLLADKLVSDKSARPVPEVISFLNNSLAAEVSAETDLAKREQDFGTQYSKAIQSINQQSQTIASVKADLKQLYTARTDPEVLSNIVELGIDVQSQLKTTTKH